MGGKSRIGSVPIVLLVFVIINIVELVLTVPVPAQTNGRVLRSLNRRGSWDENPTTNLLLSQPQQQTRRDALLAQRATNSSGDGSYEAELGSGDGGNGTFSNDTQAGSRLKQNETEPCSLEPPSLCSTDPTHSSRDKQRRIEHIKNYLLINLLGNRTRPANKDIVREKFSGGLESIAVSCDLPSEVESEAWSSNRYFSLYFNLTSKYPDVYSSSENSSAEQEPQEQQNRESGQSHEYVPVIGSQPFASKFTLTPNKGVNIISAKLRLYKTGVTESTNMPTLGNIEPSESFNDTETAKEDEVLPNVFSTRMTFPQFSPSSDEKIRVSVYWYTQPATKNHYKKKLVDTKMLPLRESSWVEFDIKNAVAAWLNDRKPNYGLVVEVENENQDVLDPRKYFHGAPCFKSSEGSYQRDESGKEQEDGNNNNGRTGENPSTSPMIEICTLNVPETTTSYEHTKFFPFPMNINSFSHLQRVAESHARSSNSSKPRTSPWQNVNLSGLSPEDFSFVNPSTSERSRSPKPTTIVFPTHHKHRHHHNLDSQNNNDNNNGLSQSEQQPSSENQRNKSRFSQSSRGFTLHEDHPLREILASVNGNSKEANKRGSQFVEAVGKGFPSHVFSEMPADEGRVSSDYIDSTEHERDVIITKIVITPAQLKESGLNGIANRRAFFPFASSTSSSSSSPTDPTNAESSER